MFDPFFLLDCFSDLPAADIDVEIPEEYACNELDGVENGVFVGDEDDLAELAEAGEIDDTDHLGSEDIVRNIAARNEYLSSIGFDDLPEGWEVHHIIPLSEGGIDDPSNMVLLEKEDHAAVTAQHRNFYGWNKE